MAKRLPPSGQSVYTDYPDRDDAASTSSAVLMNDIIDYPEAAPPPYEDTPTSLQSNSSDPRELVAHLLQPSLPSSQLSRDETTTTTHWPEYSQDANSLTKMLDDQAKYPPTFTARITGTHSETIHKKDKKEKTTVTDFDVRLDMTHLLVPGPNTPQSLRRDDFEIPLPGTKAYRGDRTKHSCPSTMEETAPSADTYVDAYVSSPCPVRSFDLQRRITFHDDDALKKLINSLVGSTNYCGHTKITFPITRSRVRVYSPCWQNAYREKWWVRWFFYLTFLWIFSWPYLWFITRRWDVVAVVFPYSSPPDSANRQFVTKSEKDFFEEWKPSIRRAVVSKKQGCIDEEYKQATEEARLQDSRNGPNRVPSTGNAVADGALGFLHSAVTVSRDVAMAGGWGADS